MNQVNWIEFDTNLAVKIYVNTSVLERFIEMIDTYVYIAYSKPPSSPPTHQLKIFLF